LKYQVAKPEDHDASDRKFRTASFYLGQRPIHEDRPARPDRDPNKRPLHVRGLPATAPAGQKQEPSQHRQADPMLPM
jgi:hypothetical protein